MIITEIHPDFSQQRRNLFALLESIYLQILNEKDSALFKEIQDQQNWHTENSFAVGVSDTSGTMSGIEVFGYLGPASAVHVLEQVQVISSNLIPHMRQGENFFSTQQTSSDFSLGADAVVVSWRGNCYLLSCCGLPTKLNHLLLLSVFTEEEGVSHEFSLTRPLQDHLDMLKKGTPNFGETFELFHQ